MDELDLLARALPDARPPSPEVVRRARARLAGGTRAARRGRPWAVWAAVATTGIVGVVFALVANLAPAPVAVRPADPGQALLDLAVRVERQPGRDGAYWRTTTTTGRRMYAGTYTVLVTAEAEHWYPRDDKDPALTRWLAQAVRPDGRADERAWRAAGAPKRITPDCPSGSATAECRELPLAGTTRPGCVYIWGVHRENPLSQAPLEDVTLAGLKAIPAEPRALDAYLRDRHKSDPSQPVQTFVATKAARLLGLPLSPGQRAAVLRLLAAHPLTRVGGTVTDPLGRKGLSVSFGDQAGLDLAWYAQGRSTTVSTTSTYVIDPGTGETLAEIETANQALPGLAKGTALSYDAFESGWTDGRPDRPRACSPSR
ncbi:hypothetical protein ACU635_02020 [[Actinomadura] parvosata]|uniref:hypothetical protein n=1 Tax=[Actinomadura] parvosata TaxID=1955412 RepID=UPI00406D4D87